MFQFTPYAVDESPASYAQTHGTPISSITILSPFLCTEPSLNRYALDALRTDGGDVGIDGHRLLIAV